MLPCDANTGSHDDSRCHQFLVKSTWEAHWILELLDRDLLLHSNCKTILLVVGLPRFARDSNCLHIRDKNLCGTRLGNNLVQPVGCTIYIVFCVPVFFCIRKSTCTSALLDLAAQNLCPRLHAHRLEDFRHVLP